MSIPNPYNYSKPKGVLSTNNILMGQKRIDEFQNVAPKVVNKATSSMDKYLEQKIMSSKPEELTLMLFDGAIKFLNQTKLFNDQKDISKSHGSNVRAQLIIEELKVTLDPKIELSKSLDALYDFMLRRLLDANINKSNEIIDEVLDLIKDLRDTWKEAFKL